VGKLFKSQGECVFRAEESFAVGLWLLKTWLLLGHPSRLDPEEGISLPRWWEAEDAMYRWMISAQDPPEGMSVWVTKVLPDDYEGGPSWRIFLPTVIADNMRFRFESQVMALTSVEVCLLYHPGWEVEHPLESGGKQSACGPWGQGR
jgi:hypothetical protein